MTSKHTYTALKHRLELEVALLRAVDAAREHRGEFNGEERLPARSFAGAMKTFSVAEFHMIEDHLRELGRAG